MHERCNGDHVTPAQTKGEPCSHQSLKAHIHILRKCHGALLVICSGTSAANTVQHVSVSSLAGSFVSELALCSCYLVGEKLR